MMSAEDQQPGIRDTLLIPTCGAGCLDLVLYCLYIMFPNIKTRQIVGDVHELYRSTSTKKRWKDCNSPGMIPAQKYLDKAGEESLVHHWIIP